MTSQRFDILILGDELSGLITANLLSHFNYKVVVLRNSPGIDRYQYKGYVLPVSPQLLPPLKFGELLSQIRQYLSLSQDEFEDDADVIERFQYITKRLRVDVSVDKNETIEEFFYELGIKKEKTGKFIESTISLMSELSDIFNMHLPYPVYSFWDKRRIKKNYFAEFSHKNSSLEYFDDEKVKNIFRGLLCFISNTEVQNIFSSQESLLGFLFLDRWLLLPSIERLKSLLLKRLEERGNLIFNGTNNRFMVEKKGFNYYLLDEKRHHSFRIDSVLLSSNSEFVKENIHPKLYKRLNLKEQKYYVRYTTNFVVKSGCIPEIASKYIVYNKNPNGYKPDDFFQISTSKSMKDRAIIRENQVVSVTTFIEPQEFNRKNVDIFNKRLQDVLIQVFPFIDENIINMSSVLEADLLLDINMNEVKRGEYKYSQCLFNDFSLIDGILLTDMKTGIDNFINSFSVFAPIGIFGDFMAAVRAAEIISKNVLGK